MRLGPPPEEPEVPGQFWIDFIRDTAPVFRKPTIEQLGEFIAPTWQALIDGAKYVHPRLLEIIDELAPDVIVEDNVVGFPALAVDGPAVGPARCRATRPRSRIRRRAVLVGLPGRRPVRVAGFLDEVDRTHRDMWADFDAFCREHGLPGCRTARSARTSSRSRRGSTSTATRPRPTTRDRRRWDRRGTGSTRRSAPPRRRGSCPNTSRAATAR